MISLRDSSKEHIIHDLVGYCRDKRADVLRVNLKTDTPDLDNLCCAVFLITLVSAFVGSSFSKIDYNQSKIRSRHTDKMMSSILNLHDVVVGDPMKPLTKEMLLKTHVVFIMEKEKIIKHVGKVVCKFFDGTRYHGRIIDVVHHEIYGRWMYKIQCVDGDCEDFWRSELELLMCRCEGVDHSLTLIP